MAPSPRERYADFLASKGRRLTRHAARVVDAISSVPGTFDAEAIVATMRGEASRATVYRVLAGLVEAELLQRLPFEDQTVYVVAASPDPST